MNIDHRRASPLVLGFAMTCLPPAAAQPNDPASVRALAAEAVVAWWPPISALAARRLIGQYGPPDEVQADRLAWNDNRPWKRTIVRRMAPHDAGAEVQGVIAQTVEYPLTPRQVAELMAFDPRLTYNRKSWELGSRSEREEINFLRLNLANDIVNARMTPEQARALFAQILRLEAAGKSASYLQVLHLR